MSTILPALYGIYRRAGYEPLTGHSPHHFFGFRDAPFTRFLKKKEIVGVWGLSLQEVMFLEHFRDFVSPRRIFIIGNAHGWSTIAFALMFPQAKVLAIDIDPVGVEVTNALIDANRLNAQAVTARSPDDVVRVAKEHFDGAVDFSLIDAVHRNDALAADFDAVMAISADHALHLFHDIINWNLIQGFQAMVARHGLSGCVFTRTASGMALASRDLEPEFLAYLTELRRFEDARGAK